MNTLRTILAELWGLFVDDGPLAVCIIAWVALAAGLRHVLPPVVLFVGLAVLVLVFTVRRAALLSAKEKKR